MNREECLMWEKGASDPEWNPEFCRCANNGDYCDYCAGFHDPESVSERMENENPEAI